MKKEPISHNAQKHHEKRNDHTPNRYALYNTDKGIRNNVLLSFSSF